MCIRDRTCPWPTYKPHFLFKPELTLIPFSTTGYWKSTWIFFPLFCVLKLKKTRDAIGNSTTYLYCLLTNNFKLEFSCITTFNWMFNNFISWQRNWSNWCLGFLQQNYDTKMNQFICCLPGRLWKCYLILLYEVICGVVHRIVYGSCSQWDSPLSGWSVF